MSGVIVIGGGIAGLSAAFYLQRQAVERGYPLELTVLEGADHWGGKMVTRREGGFVVEGGPDTFLATKPWGVELCRQLGLASRLHGTNPHLKKTYILHGGRLEPIPDGLTMMIPARFSPLLRTRLLSWPAKARMGLDFLIPPRQSDGDESLGAFITRRLGRAAYERLIEPLMSGIYAGDGDQLSLGSTLPYLQELEQNHGGLIRGALAIRRTMAANGRPTSGSRSAFLTPTRGLAEIVEALVERLEAGGASLRRGAVAVRILPEDCGYRVEMANGNTLSARGLILATPAYVSGELLAAAAPSLAAELGAIPYVSTATVSVAYHQTDLSRPLDGYGYVIPRREGRVALACTWTSTKFPHRAPDGEALLRVFIGRAGQEGEIPWDDSGLLSVAQEELKRTLGITAEPRRAWVYRWERAMPQYNLGHLDRLRRIDTHLRRWSGLKLAGNGYRGVGIPDCIHSGEVAAHQVLAVLMAEARALAA